MRLDGVPSALDKGNVMPQPFVEPCGRGVIDAEPCPRELGREIPASRRRMVLAGCVLASSMAFVDGSVLTVALPESSVIARMWNAFATIAAGLLLNSVAMAQDYPSRPITIIVPWPPGAVTDILARFVAEGLRTELNQPVLAENRTGASGNARVGVRRQVQARRECRHS